MDEKEKPQAQLKVRIDRDLREYLEAAASARGVSLNREIADRLERSREGESLYEQHLGGKEIAAITEIVGMTMKLTKNTLGAIDPVAIEKGWLQSPYTFDQSVRAVGAVLETLRPAGDMPDLSGDAAWMERAGEGLGREVLGQVAYRTGPWQERVAGMLGELLDKERIKERICARPGSLPGKGGE
jgi:hypothetical protein